VNGDEVIVADIGSNITIWKFYTPDEAEKRKAQIMEVWLAKSSTGSYQHQGGMGFQTQGGGYQGGMTGGQNSMGMGSQSMMGYNN